MIFKELTPEHSVEILKEMCKRVGIKYEDFDFSQENWYLKHEWSPEEEEDFHWWLAKFLLKHKYVSKKNYRGQDHGYYEASKFIMNYGWKLSEEEWRDIPQYEDVYQVSNYARIRNKKGFIISPALNKKSGYLYIMLNKDGKKNTGYIHRLTAAAFIPNPDNKREVNHKDGNKKNNSLRNLEWTTRQENATHAKNNGLLRKGEQIVQSKLTEGQIQEIREKYKPRKYNMKKLSEEYGVAQSQIHRIVKRKQWEHV